MIQNAGKLIQLTNTLEGYVRRLAGGTALPSSLIHIDELPPPPNRLTNHSTFHVDSLVFIDALYPFKTILNTDLIIMTWTKPNRWNLGDIVETNIFPEFTQYTGNPSSIPKPSVQYISSIDTEYEYLRGYSRVVNDVLQWFDKIQTERGSVDVWNLPTLDIKPLPSPMTRIMGETEFNSKSVALSKSMRDHTASILQVKQQMDNWFNTTMDMGYITDAVTTTIDCGNITDATISN